jgi:hypothetical protein
MSLECNLLDSINNLSFKLLNLPDFFNIQVCDYSLPERLEASFSIKTIPQVFDIDIKSEILKQICNDLTTKVVNNSLQEMSNSSNIVVDFIDKRGLGDITIIPYSDIEDFVSEIVNQCRGYKNIVCSGSVAIVIQDDSRLHFSPQNENFIKTQSFIYKVGVICGINVWIDPYMKYNDYKIMAFNDIDIKLSGLSSKIVSESNFDQKIIIGFTKLTSIGDVKKLYIIINESSEGWMIFVQKNRDSKINNILNEEK